jgi:hypothetical protein
MAESKRFLLRLNPDLFEVLRRWADDDLRSINAQIEYLLADQARRAGRLAAKPVKRPLEAGRAHRSSTSAPVREAGDGHKPPSGARSQA